MKHTQILLLLLLLGGTNISGMITPGKIYVENNIGGNRDIIIKWDKKETKGKIEPTVSPEKTSLVMDFDQIVDGSTIEFAAGGQLLKFSAISAYAKKEQLKEEFQKLSPTKDDKLLITVSQPPFSAWLHLTYGLYTPPKKIKVKDNILDEFPRIASYKGLAELEEKDIPSLSLEKVGEEIMQKFPGFTREDIYRYILGLSTDPTEEQVKEAYKRLSLQWHPDKHPEQHEYAERVIKIVNTAHEELMKKFD